MKNEEKSEKIICQICKKHFKNWNLLSKHIMNLHKIKVKEYYDKYLKKENEGICLMYGKISSCKKFTSFSYISKGYCKFCSKKCSANSKDVRQKTVESNNKRFNADYPYQSKKIMKKMQKDYFERTGYQLGSNPEVIQKIRDANILKYNDNKIKLYVSKRMLQSSFKKIITFCKKINIEFVDVINYKGDIFNHKWKCLKCNNVFLKTWKWLRQSGKCPICFPPKYNISKNEVEISKYVKSLDFEIITNSKNILINKNNLSKSQELDIYIPNLKIAIEHNGMYRHSEQFMKNKNYHLNKTLKCNALGIRLIHIFEHEWTYGKESMKILLKKILKEDWDLLPEYNFESITLNRRFCKSPKYYEKLSFKIKIIEPRYQLNNDGYKVWDCGYLSLTRTH